MAILKVKVIPGASRNEITGMWQDMVKIKVMAHSESGKANDACMELLSDRLEVQKNRIAIVRGHKSREKLLEIRDLSDTELSNKLAKKFNLRYLT